MSDSSSVVVVARTLSLAWLFFSLTGCAALRAPVEFPPSPGVSPTAPELKLEPIEGRPNGLLLSLGCDCEPPEGAWLQLLRAEGDAGAKLFRNIRLNPTLRARLLNGGIEFLDRSVDPGTTRYKLQLRASKDNAPARLLGASKTLAVTWVAPPERPTGVAASSVIAGAVELRWQAPPGAGALIFRRNVLEPDAPLQRRARVGPASRGVFIDRQVEPAGVYAYRVALAIDTKTTIQFGRPSEEIYVTVHSAPNADRSAGEARQSQSGS